MVLAVISLSKLSYSLLLLILEKANKKYSVLHFMRSLLFPDPPKRNFYSNRSDKLLTYNYKLKEAGFAASDDDESAFYDEIRKVSLET